MLFRLTIRKVGEVDSWVENEEFPTASIKDATVFAQSIVDAFNESLRPGEKAFELFSVVPASDQPSGAGASEVEAQRHLVEFGTVLTYQDACNNGRYVVVGRLGDEVRLIDEHGDFHHINLSSLQPGWRFVRQSYPPLPIALDLENGLYCHVKPFPGGLRGHEYFSAGDLASLVIHGQIAPDAGIYFLDPYPEDAHAPNAHPFAAFFAKIDEDGDLVLMQDEP